MKTRLLTTLTAAIMALSSWAQKEQSDIMYFLFDKETKTASVTSGKLKYEGNIIIPASVTDPTDGTTYSVTSIGSMAFRGCKGLKSISIPNSVTSIGYSAFFGCSGLTNINIPGSVTSIGGLAFSFCSGLKSITIPNSVTSIGGGAFEGCTSLTSVKVEAGNTKYDSRDNCNAIIETASNTLVVGCKATTIPSSVTSIGEDAFGGCTGLTSITIPSSVTSIGWGAFRGCTGLTSIIAQRTNPAAYNCSAQAFDNYSAILEVPTGCKEAYNAIEPWSKFSRRNIEINDFNLVVDDRTLTATVTKNKIHKGSITIPSSVTFEGKVYSVTSIGSSVFAWEKIKSITIPSSVTSIGDFAFYCCRSLKSITIPSSVTSIGSSAFIICDALKSIIIPGSVTSIGNDAFSGCTGLKSVTIPNSVTSIGIGAFDGCTGLKSITALRTNPKEYNCNQFAFEEPGTYWLLHHRATLHVPAGCKTAYQNCEPWSKFHTIIDDAPTE